MLLWGGDERGLAALEQLRRPKKSHDNPKSRHRGEPVLDLHAWQKRVLIRCLEVMLSSKRANDLLEDGIDMVMAFLHENGWSNALRGLEKDTGRSFDTKAHEGAKGGLLLSAISLSKEKWAAEQDAKSKGGEKRRAMRAIEENLTNPKGGRVPCVAPGRVFSGLHDANIITTRFCPRDAQSDIAGSADVRGKLTLVDTKAGKVAGVIPPGLFKAPVITMDFSPRDPVMAIGCMDGSHHIMSFALPNAQGGRVAVRAA